MSLDYDAWIIGEPASAKNQRRIVKIRQQTRIIKSEKALAYAASFAAQAPVLDPLIESDVSLRVDVWYRSRRPDLACVDLIQDLLQGVAIANDRQVKASASYWNLDKENPRVRICLKKFPENLEVGCSTFKLSQIW